MTPVRRERILLLAGIAVPIIYFGTLILAGFFFPGYSHATQFASELGGPDAPIPQIFNTGIMILGVVGIASGFGFFYALRALTGKAGLALMTGLCVGLFGIAMIMGGVFSMPDPRHGAFGLGLALHGGPLFLLLAVRTRTELRALNVYLAIILVLMVVLIAVLMGVGGLVTSGNVGIFQRAYALASFPWIGIASYVLVKELGAAAEPRVETTV